MAFYIFIEILILLHREWLDRNLFIYLFIYLSILTFIFITTLISIFYFPMAIIKISC